MHLTTALALGFLPAIAVAEDVYCLSLQDCQEAAIDVGIASYFYSDDCKGISGCSEISTETMGVTTKGCFTKTSLTGIQKAFFFLGDGKAMTAEVSPPRQERLYCEAPNPPTPTPPTPTPPTPTPPTPTPPPTNPQSSGFNCPSSELVGCTAVDPSNPVDECPTVGEPCVDGNPGDYCCLDSCRKYCTAKEAPATTKAVSMNKSNLDSAGSTTSVFGAAAILVLVTMSLFV